MIFGVDSHRSTLSVAGVDELGRVQVAMSFGNLGASRQVFAATPIQSLVLHPGDLPGWRVPANLERQGPAAFAKQHGKALKVIVASGVEGTTAKLRGPGQAFGLSITARYRSARQAAVEATRLHKSNLKQDRGLTATPITLPTAPGAQACRISGIMQKHPVTGYEIVVTRGPILSELFVIALAKDIHQTRIFAAAGILANRIAAAS